YGRGSVTRANASTSILSRARQQAVFSSPPGNLWRKSGVCSFMRLLVLIALGLPLCGANDDARDIVRKSVNVGDDNVRIARDYTFRERNEGRTLDSSGRVTKTEVETYDVTLVDGSPYRRLLQRDDKPLPPKDERKEEEKLRKIADARRKETPAQ